jgi:hypothetical protein
VLQEPSVLDEMESITIPFTTAVWLAAVGAVVLFALAFDLVEPPITDDEPEPASEPTDASSPPPSASPPPRRASAARLFSMVRRLYETGFQFFAGPDPGAASTLPGRIINLGFALFVTVNTLSLSPAPSQTKPLLTTYAHHINISM